MIFRQLFERESCTYTYLLGCEKTRQAVLIDTVKSEAPLYLQLLEELSLRLIYVIDTHTHADHVTAAGVLREATGAETLIGKQSKSTCVSKTVSHGELISVGSLCIKSLHTPGHTDDSYCFLLTNRNPFYIFTGDTLLIRGTGRTDFQNGSAEAQYKSIFEQLLTLPGDTLVYPAHDYKGWSVSTLNEEKQHNPRLQVASIEDYVKIMNALDLPDPKMMDVAVPANQSCGS